MRDRVSTSQYLIHSGAAGMNLVLFEDDAFRTLAPLCHPHPVFALRMGAFTPLERVSLQFKDYAASYLCREYLAPAVQAATGGAPVNAPPKGDCLFVNGAALAGGDSLARLVDGVAVGSALISGRRLLAAKVKPSGAFDLFGYLKVILTRGAGEAGGVPPMAESLKKLGIETSESDVPLVRYPWQLVGAAGGLLLQDWSFFSPRRSSYDASVSSAAHLLEQDSIHIGSGVSVAAGAVIDATGGPVVLDDGARIQSNAVIYGPCYVGKNTLIKAGSRIYGPSSFGPVCKLGGEISETVIQGFSNKQHEGFLGHAVLGEWVNIGAGTEVSDLKNNYGPVKIWADGRMVDSGERFVGPTIGDHTKTGINSMLNSGAVVGFCCNVFGSEYLPKFVPSFSWGGAAGLVEHDPAKAIATAAAAMARRGIDLGEDGESLFREIYEITRRERQGVVPEGQ
jgi:UDP-N-acetylglucosamine diphosphorylase/glucosamine-1-phosphate N-acetyltransferase